MPEQKIAASVLSLVAQPVVCVRKDIISYMNPAAIRLAGKDMTGKPAAVLFPSHITDKRSGDFAATAFVGKWSCIINAHITGSEQIYVLSPESTSECPDAAVFASMRSSLANLRLCGSRISQLAEMRDDEVLRSYAVSVNRSYYRMKRNIDNLNLIDLMQRGEYPLFTESTDLSELFSKLIDSINILSGRGTVINFNAPDELHIVVDRYLAELALLNLISNSLAHCGENGRISISLLRTDKSTVIAVNDNGSGISAEDLPRIFDRHRSSGDLVSVADGVGLGLAVVRSIAELHGGALIIESRGLGHGTSVRLMLSNFSPVSRNLKAGQAVYENSHLSGILQELSLSLPDDCYASMTDD